MWQRFRLPILSGILIGTSYIPFPPWALFFCFVPLWSQWLKDTSAKQIWWSGWVTQFVLTMIGFNWVAHTVHEFGHLPWPVAAITLLLFSAFASLHIPLAGVVWWWLNKKFQVQGLARVWLMALLIAAGERLYPMIFDWHFGYTWLWAQFPGAHFADVVGFLGLSHISVLLNVLIFSAWTNRAQRRECYKPLVLGAFILAGVNLLGYWRDGQVAPPDRSARVLIVQANIGNLEKQFAQTGWGFRAHILQRYTSLTQQGLQQSPDTPIDFALWPETAFPDSLGANDFNTGYARQLRDFLKQNQLNLITGSYGRLSQTGQTTNSLFALTKEGEWADKPYDKTMLLAFGEYIPGSKWLPQLKTWLPQVSDFGRGEGPRTLLLDGRKLGAQICYEGLFDWFSVSLARQGAHLLINVTNDSWFGRWQQPWQHLYMTLARAIETRLPLVRSTNTGISTVISAKGEIQELSPLHQEWFHLYEVPYNEAPQPTPFVRFGFWLVPTLLLWAIAGILGKAWLGRVQKS